MVDPDEPLTYHGRVRQAAKRWLLPEPGPRRLRLGIGRGVCMEIDFQHQTRMYCGLYETELNRHLRRLLRPGVTALDVGASVGYDSLVIARHTLAPVVAFERSAEALEAMVSNIALNQGLADLIRVEQASIGCGPGEVGLDDWCEREGFVPDFIKLDIEGAEADALRSAIRILSAHHPHVIVEVHSLRLEAECGDFLLGLGYRPLVLTQRRVVPDRRIVAHNRWLVAESPSAPNARSEPSGEPHLTAAH